MKLTMLAKDEDSGRTGCQSVYVDPHGWAVVQGLELDEDTASSLVNFRPGEQGVRIKASILIDAVAALQRR